MTRLLGRLLLLALIPLAAGAQEAPPPSPTGSTVHRHLGFFIRPELGFGYFSAKASQGGDEIKISGGAGMFGIAIGGASPRTSSWPGRSGTTSPRGPT